MFRAFNSQYHHACDAPYFVAPKRVAVVQRHDFQKGMVILQEVKIAWGVLPVSDIFVSFC